LDAKETIPILDEKVVSLIFAERKQHCVVDIEKSSEHVRGVRSPTIFGWVVLRMSLTVQK
jgi:hypothetical protein